MLETLQSLCTLNGTSGREEDVRRFIIEEIKNDCEYTVDPMGNVLCFKKGRQKAKNKVLLTAHMDEVGFIVTYISDDGGIQFAPVGGIDSKVVLGRQVCFAQNERPIYGVIGIKPVHLCTAEERSGIPDISEMYIDIGASSKQEAEKYVSIGDSIYFVSKFETLGKKRVLSKAIDDRFGCAALISMLKAEQPYDMYAAFLVQEEVGLRGSQAASFTVRPDYAIVMEATTASDISGVSGADRVCVLGDGAVISFMDRSTVYNRELFLRALSLAKEKNIKVQVKTKIAGGNDAGSIHKSCGGVKTLTVSLPCRYIHSPSSVADIGDMEECVKLSQALFEEYANA